MGQDQLIRSIVSMLQQIDCPNTAARLDQELRTLLYLPPELHELNGAYAQVPTVKLFGKLEHYKGNTDAVEAAVANHEALGNPLPLNERLRIIQYYSHH